MLAAGSSSRMGTQKLLLPVRGIPMIDRVLAACSAFPTILICHPELVEGPRATRAVTFITNHNPELGMVHSLQLADAAAPEGNALLVFLADKPLVTAELAQTIVTRANEANADVCFPQRDGVGGHPVYFSPRARARLVGLSGDSLQPLRDDPSLRRVGVPVSDPGAYTDVDDPEALARLNAE